MLEVVEKSDDSVVYRNLVEFDGLAQFFDFRQGHILLRYDLNIDISKLCLVLTPNDNVVTFVKFGLPSLGCCEDTALVLLQIVLKHAELVLVLLAEDFFLGDLVGKSVEVPGFVATGGSHEDFVPLVHDVLGIEEEDNYALAAFGIIET